MRCILNQIYAAQPAIEKIVKMDIPVVEAFKWGKLIKAINEELSQFENCRKNLVNKYADKDEEGKYSLPEENKEAFNDEIRKLLDVEVELNTEPLDLTKLGDIKISAVEVMSLEPFIFQEGEAVPLG